MATGANSADPNFGALLRLLADLGADSEQTRKALDIYIGPTLSVADTITAAAPTDPLLTAPNTCADSVAHVSLGRKMPKIRGLRGAGCLRIYSGAWYALYRRYLWVEGAGRKAKLQKDWLGRVSDMSEEQARQVMNAKISRVHRSVEPTADFTVREFYERHYLPEHIEKLAKASQNQLISTFQNYILPGTALGGVLLRDVTLGLLQQHCDMIYEAGKTGTVEKVKFALSGMFKRAKAHRLVDHNPATDVLLPRNIQRRVLRAPTLEEVRPLIAALAEPALIKKYLRHKTSEAGSRLDPLDFMRVRAMVLLDCALAMGHAETTGLRLKWVNLTSEIVEREGRVLPPCSLAVEANHNRGEWGPPKTKSRRRILPLSGGLVDALAILIESANPQKPEDAVFGTGDKPIDYSTSLRILKAAGRHADIGWINWHSLRRFFANISSRLGVPLEERQYILGHTFAAMTAHYTTLPDIERKRPYVEQITSPTPHRNSLARCPAVSASGSLSRQPSPTPLGYCYSMNRSQRPTDSRAGSFNASLWSK